jgi:hypothetical protein
MLNKFLEDHGFKTVIDKFFGLLYFLSPLAIGIGAVLIFSVLVLMHPIFVIATTTILLGFGLYFKYGSKE